MELIAADQDRNELYELEAISADFSFGARENDFAVTVRNSEYLEKGCWIVQDGGEWGGRVTGVDNQSDENAVKLLGMTWHGVLNSRVVRPPEGSVHYVADGDANAVIGAMISSIGLDSVFKANPADSGVAISAYKVSSRDDDGDADRFVPAYDAMSAMLADHGARLRIEYDRNVRKAVVSAVPAYDWSVDDEWDSDYCSVSIKRNAYANHILALGAGEGSDRTVEDFYISEDGIVSQTATQTGLDMITEKYDYSSASTLEKLREGAAKKLAKNLAAATNVKVEFNAADDGFFVGDRVGAHDSITGITASATIIQKTLRLKGGGIADVEYETGLI